MDLSKVTEQESAGWGLPGLKTRAAWLSCRTSESLSFVASAERGDLKGYQGRQPGKCRSYLRSLCPITRWRPWVLSFSQQETLGIEGSFPSLQVSSVEHPQLAKNRCWS